MIYTMKRAQIVLMHPHEARETARLIHDIILNVPWLDEQDRLSQALAYSPEALRHFISQHPTRVLIAKDRHYVVGFCLHTRESDHYRLAWYGVHPDWRQHGIGSDLIGSFMHLMRAEWAGCVRHHCHLQNRVSYHILQSYGFQEVESPLPPWRGKDYHTLERKIELTRITR